MGRAARPRLRRHRGASARRARAAHLSSRSSSHGSVTTAAAGCPAHRTARQAPCLAAFQGQCTMDRHLGQTSVAHPLEPRPQADHQAASGSRQPAAGSVVRWEVRGLRRPDRRHSNSGALPVHSQAATRHGRLVPEGSRRSRVRTALAVYHRRCAELSRQHWPFVVPLYVSYQVRDTCMMTADTTVPVPLQQYGGAGQQGYHQAGMGGPVPPPQLAPPPHAAPGGYQGPPQQQSVQPPYQQPQFGQQQVLLQSTLEKGSCLLLS